MFKKYYNEYNDKFNEELNKTGIFWAFSNQQFNENKTHKNAPNSEYLTIGDGGYLHKSDKEKFDNFHKNIVPKLREELKSKINIEDLIKFELENHECYYIGDFTEVIFIIYDFYRELSIQEIHDKVSKVFNENKEKYLSELDETDIKI